MPTTRIESLAMLRTDGGKEYLAEEYGKVIENVQRGTISGKIKNTDLSGDPTAGTIIAKRFVNAKSQEYGTARKGGKGNNVKDLEVSVPIDRNREFIEEVEEKDVKLGGVSGLVEKRTANHGKRLEAELDEEFFRVAVKDGSNIIPTEAGIIDIIDEAIDTLVNTKNDFIDGIDRSLISVTCNSTTYSKVRKYLDKLPSSHVETDKEEFMGRHGVRYFEEIRLPAGVRFVVMMDGSVAQPVRTSISAPGKVPFSDATAFGMFVYYGTKTVTPETIIYYSVDAANSTQTKTEDNAEGGSTE